MKKKTVISIHILFLWQKSKWVLFLMELNAFPSTSCHHSDSLTSLCLLIHEVKRYI